jgi:NTE family protein
MQTRNASETAHTRSGSQAAELGAHDSEASVRNIHQLRPRSRNHTAFVFSGGGARGALHVGALRALLEHGVRPDVVVGTSIGAWNAAWLARTPTPDGVEALAEVWGGLEPARVLFGRALPAHSPLRLLLMLAALRRVAGGCSSLYGDTGLRQVLAHHFAGVTFEDLALPLRVIAADLTHGGRTVFGSGPVLPAVLASSAIPGIFPPVQIGAALYGDGGTVDGCSVETAVELGARRIFVLAIGYDTVGDGGARWSCDAAARGDGRSPYSAAAVIQRASQVMGNYQIQRALERLPQGVEAHVIRLSTGDGSGTLNFSGVSGWIDQAYATTREYLRSALPHDETAPVERSASWARAALAAAASA